VFFQLEEQHELISVTIYDSLGKILKVQEFNDITQFELELPNEQGLYFVNLNNQSKNSTFRIIKN